MAKPVLTILSFKLFLSIELSNMSKPFLACISAKTNLSCTPTSNYEEITKEIEKQKLEEKTLVIA